METIPSPIYYEDINLNCLYCNTAFCQFVKKEFKDILNHPIHDLDIDSDFLDACHHISLESLQTKEKQSVQTMIQFSNEEFYHVVLNNAPVIDENQEVQGLITVVNDITDEVISKEKLRRLKQLKDIALDISNFILEKNSLEELFNSIIEKVLDSNDYAHLGCLIIKHKDDTFTIVSSIGYSREDVKNFSFNLEESFQWISTNGNIDKNTIIINDMQEVFAKYNLHALDTADGKKVNSSISAPIIIDGELYGLLNIDSCENNVFDEYDLIMMEHVKNQLIIAIKKFQLYESIIYLAEHDPKTNLFNRGHFDKIFEMVRERAIRYDEKFLVVIFDLNGLKKVNDSLGHLAGDEIILHFSTTLKNWVRTSDILARYGGDEFIGILFNAEKNDIIDRLENLRINFEKNPIEYENEKIICSFSYGIAEFPHHGTTYDSLVEVADQHMYTYKRHLKQGRK